MTLHLKSGEGFTKWNPKVRVNGLLLPRNCEALWSDDELNAHGLFKEDPAADTPKGKMIASTVVTEDGKRVRKVHTYKPAPQRVSKPRPNRDAAILALIAGDSTAAQAAMDEMG